MNRINYTIKWKSLLSSVLNIGLLLESIKFLCMLLYRLNGCLDSLSHYWGYDENTGLYYFVNQIYNSGKGACWLWAICVLDSIAIILLFIWLMRKNRKIKLLIIQHSSLQKMSFTYDLKELDDYSVKKFNINQYDILHSSRLSMDKMIFGVINQIVEILPRILKYVTRGYQIGYAGIANIPAIFFLGYELGDENKKLYFHKFRTDPSDDNFHILRPDCRQTLCKSEEKPNDPAKHGKILALIQFSKPISSEDISNILEPNDYIIKYEVPETIDYDIVDSSRQLSQYADQIVNDIARIEKGHNMQAVKICVAASSSFIFGLGTKFSKTQDKDIVIYHFQNNTYPWGINVTKRCPVIANENNPI